ncbi:hypothetical protein KA996_08690 [bacterium]|nr:hypothetical protein [bacterium]
MNGYRKEIVAAATGTLRGLGVREEDIAPVGAYLRGEYRMENRAAEYVNQQEAAAIISTSRYFVRDLVNKGLLKKYLLPGGLARYKRSEVLALLREEEK